MKTIVKGLIASAVLVISCQKVDIQEEITPSLIEKDKEVQLEKNEYGVSLKTASYLGKLLSQKEIKGWKQKYTEKTL